MKYERSDSFKADYNRLTDNEREMFREAVRTFAKAADRCFETKNLSDWPHTLRVKGVQRARGVFEMTWSFSKPDGRATWEWATVTDDAGHGFPAVRWRRIGDHKILRDP